MPFDVLSALQFATMPEVGRATAISNLTTSTSGNPEAGHGSLVLSTDAESGETKAIYTDAIGNVTESTWDVYLDGPQSYSISDFTGSPLGFGSKSFAFLISQDGDPVANLPDSPGVLVVEVGDDGKLIAEAEVEFIWPIQQLDENGDFAEDASGEFIFEPAFSTPLTVSRMDDGQLGFTDRFGQVGEFELFNIKDDFVEQFAFGPDAQAHTMVLPDGSLVVVASTSTSEVTFEVVHIAADGTLVDRQTVDSEAQLAAVGLEAATTQVHVAINENADLVLSFTEDDVTYATTLDLLTVTEADEQPIGVTNPTEDDDILTLTADDDVIDALGGHDTVFGGGGDDQLIGGKGFDLLNGGAGNDSLFGGNSKDGLYGEAGDDVLFGGVGKDFLSGGEGNDELYGGKGNDTVFGGAGDDKLLGEDNDDSLYGDIGDDNLFGGKGYDLLNGGSGGDTLFGGNSKDELHGGTGDDDLFGDAGRDFLNGGDGNDALYGGNGDDTVIAGAGDDLLTGGSGDDVLVGGEGADLFQFETSDAGDTNSVRDFIVGEDKIEILDSDIELTFDDLTMVQEEGFAVIQVGEFAIRLQGVDAESLNADDFLFGGKINDVVVGGSGDDLLIGGDGHDQLYGADGNDSLYGDNGDDTLFGGAGRDSLFGGAGDDDISGGDGDDARTVGGDFSGLYGGDGDDIVRGDLGNDQLFGGDGNDTLDGGEGDDRVSGDDGDDHVFGFDGADFVGGGNGNDTLYGGLGDDLMSGGFDDDTLYGGDGADQLHGGPGNDVLNGGNGADLFQFRTAYTGDTNTVGDFTSGEDKIEILDAEVTLTFDDIFLSQEDSVTVIQAGETIVRLENVEATDLSESDFLFTV